MSKINESIAAPEISSNLKKAACLLLSLGESASADMLKRLSETEAQRLAEAVATVQNVNPHEAEDVLEEFHELLVAQEYVLKGGLEHAKRMLIAAFGAEPAKRLLAKLQETFGAGGVGFRLLQRADPQQLAKFIHNEHPQTIALILSRLDAAPAATLLNSLPPELRGDVAVRMASLDQISPEIIHKITSVIGQKLKSLGEFNRESYGGVRAVADIVNRLDLNASKALLADIEQANPELGESIRKLMFVFEDLLSIDHSGIKEIISRVDRRYLTIALKGTSEQLRKHIFSLMSQRGAEMLREDIEALGPVKIRDVEAAQQQVISVVRQLEAEGVLSIRDGAADQYVV